LASKVRKNAKNGIKESDDGMINEHEREFLSLPLSIGQ